MKSPLSNIRIIVMLRRIWKSLERANEIALQRLEFDMEQAGYGPKKVPKKAEFGVVSVEDLNKNWLKKHPEEM